MTQFKLVALDLDDTLLDAQLLLSPRTKAAIRAARAAGIMVTIATGRMYRSARPFAVELDLAAPLITYQGALVKTVAGELFYYRPVPLELAHLALDIINRYDLHVNAYIDDNLYAARRTPAGDRYLAIAKVPLHEVGDLRRFLATAPAKLVVVADEEILDELAAELVLSIGEKLYITKSKPYFLEIMHPQARKGLALQYLADLQGINRREVIAFGDSYNDLDLLAAAGCGVAMGNSRPEIKAVADYVAPPNIEDGVAQVLEMIVAGDFPARKE